MDTLSCLEIEAALSRRLPSCTISCEISIGGALSVYVVGPDSDQLTIVGLDRARYRGQEGISRLSREILLEMIVVRQNQRIQRYG